MVWIWLWMSLSSTIVPKLHQVENFSLANTKRINYQNSGEKIDAPIVFCILLQHLLSLICTWHHLHSFDFPNGAIEVWYGIFIVHGSKHCWRIIKSEWFKRNGYWFDLIWCLRATLGEFLIFNSWCWPHFPVYIFLIDYT